MSVFVSVCMPVTNCEKVFDRHTVSSDNTLAILFRLKTCMRELMHMFYIHFKCKQVESFETSPTIVLYPFQVMDPHPLVQVVLFSLYAKM